MILLRLKQARKLIESKFFLLLLALLLIILLAPHLQTSLFGGWALVAFYFFVIFTVIYAIRSEHKLMLRIMLIQAVLNVIINVLAQAGHFYWLEIINIMIFLLFCFFALLIIFQHIIKTKSVTTDTIFGSMCVYLLIGLVFALIYQLIEIVNPGSFYYVLAASNDFSFASYDFYYFSFVTLTTLGYGDILPVTYLAKSVVIVESITGIFYLATLVARLISVRA